jgi:phage protein U
MDYMAKLGEFAFSIGTAAFQTMERVSSFRWAENERIGANPGLQFIGPGAESISLQGVIYPHFRGGLGQVDRLRTEAGAGKPLLLVYASERVGQILGYWCLEEVREVRTVFDSGGVPRKIEFSLQLKYFGDQP